MHPVGGTLGVRGVWPVATDHSVNLENLVVPLDKLEKLAGAGRSGFLCLGGCFYNTTPEKWKKMEGRMDGRTAIHPD